MQNLLFLIYRLYGGGAERVVSNLSQALNDDFNIKIATYSEEEKTYTYNGELLRIKLPFSKNVTKNNKAQRAIRFFILIYKLRKLKRLHQIDKSISFGEQANIINLLSKRDENVIISMRTTLSKEMKIAPRVRILSKLIKRLYNYADRIIVPSRLAAHDLIQLFDVDKTKVQIIYNYIDPKVINKLSKESIADLDLSNLFKKKILLNVGRITPAKGQWLLFHVFKRLKNYYPDCRLVIIGEGESEAEFKIILEKHADELGIKLYDYTKDETFSLDYDVYLLGFDSNPFRFMKHAKLLVFPSTFEGFPNTIIEAMESNLAVVAADCQSGPREILAPGTVPSNHTRKVDFAPFGVLVPSLPTSSIEDPIEEIIIDEWEKAICTLMDNNELRQKYIVEGAKRATDFEQQIILKQWKELLIKNY
jgi:glycosyltransferase involved in cell wall biosynthesis